MNHISQMRRTAHRSRYFYVDGRDDAATDEQGAAFGPALPFAFLGAAHMKKLSFVVAAGLMSLAACTNNTPAENAAENVAESMDNAADNLEDAADNATNESTEAALENAADNMSAAADNVEDAVDNGAVAANAANAM
ncbi:hypothetical protein FHS99_000983 [Sphingomonas prati]|uniref:Uncharacterized protein n=2 Tax=Sphingomonas TaxID=13687 RepID=A0A7W9BRZ7_9SPHN|nr:hypothetical protein [Sphingomonas prati]